jgi:processive 1,2-diacylglycerol beta-glucosyltransferase
MKKVLIIYASAGDGHKKAAEAIYKGFLESGDDIHAIPIDSLNYTTRFFKFFYKRTYIVLIKKFPWAWGFFYRVLDNRFFFLLAAPFRMLTNYINSKRLREFLIEENFDLIVSTHFFAPYVISRLKAKSLLSSRLINVITDFKPHLFWIAKHVDRYIVASEQTRQDLAARGISSDKVIALGIPVRRQFTGLVSRQDARRSLGLDDNKFTILIMRGGLGVGPIKEILLNLEKLDIDYQAIAVCGHNSSLKRELEDIARRSKRNIRIIGFSHNVAMLMSSSDIMISKAGGITVSESLSMGIAVICVNPIPGQESGNTEFLMRNGIGFKAKGLDDINHIIDRFWQSPEKREKLAGDIRKISRPYSADDIVKLAKEMMA